MPETDLTLNTLVPGFNMFCECNNSNSNNMCQTPEIQKLIDDIEELKAILRCKEETLRQLLTERNSCKWNPDLSSLEISRYSRQMLTPQFGVLGQQALKKSSVLVVGAGGLGCPVSVYLAAAGVGQLTLVDYDDVEVTNLHRQILHTEFDVGRLKVESAASKLKSINSSVNIIPVKLHASSETIQELMSKNKFDVVVDGTDNVASRYLLNDICIINKIPLVSGSALKMEGQLTVYGYKDGPCYRCLFPVPPPPQTVTSCGDGGVLGPVPGTIGVLQALEVIKIITEMPGVLSGRLLIFDGDDTTFRNVKLRKKNQHCEVCGERPSITAPIDYEQFCGAKAHDKIENIDILGSDETINVTEFVKLYKDGDIVIDVRPELEYKMCKLPDTINIPYSVMQKDAEKVKELIKDKHKDSKVYFLCRRGNDSQRAVSYLKKNLNLPEVNLINIKGGLHAYSKYVDNSFPVY